MCVRNIGAGFKELQDSTRLLDEVIYVSKIKDKNF